MSEGSYAPKSPDLSSFYSASASEPLAQPVPAYHQQQQQPDYPQPPAPPLHPQQQFQQQQFQQQQFHQQQFLAQNSHLQPPPPAYYQPANSTPGLDPQYANPQHHLHNSFNHAYLQPPPQQPLFQGYTSQPGVSPVFPPQPQPQQQPQQHQQPPHQQQPHQQQPHQQQPHQQQPHQQQPHQQQYQLQHQPHPPHQPRQQQYQPHPQHQQQQQQSQLQQAPPQPQPLPDSYPSQDRPQFGQQLPLPSSPPVKSEYAPAGMPPRKAPAAAATAAGSAASTPAVAPSPVKTKFPTARIKRIMQADEEVGKVSQQTPIAVGKALELFMVALVSKSAEVARTKNSKRVTAQMLKQVVESDEQWDFLRDIVKKVDPDEKRQGGGNRSSTGTAAADGPSKGVKTKAESDSEEEQPKKRGRPGRKKKV